MLKLAYVGGLGMMAGPASTHLGVPGPAQVLRVHDRGRSGGDRDRYRDGWRDHGAELVGDFRSLVGDGDLDGVVVCAGKNGDDLDIVAQLARMLGDQPGDPPFLLHLSTVSPAFAETADRFCKQQGVGYANYPLTGGPLGARLGGADPKGMLILASGDRPLYQRLLPTLERLGHPRYFGTDVSAGAVTKLIGHHMVFNGLIGIASAAALHGEYFNSGELGGEQQAEYLAFLNGGAGGTRQWDVALSKGIVDGVWDQGFMVHHAVVDAIYALRLSMDGGLPRITSQAMINTALAFAFLLETHPDAGLCTHAVVREMLRGRQAELDAFMLGRGALEADAEAALQACVQALPEPVAKMVLLEPEIGLFQEAARQA